MSILSIIPFFRGRNVWTIIGRGANSLSIIPFFRGRNVWTIIGREANSLSIIPFFRGRNVWTIIGRGANSLSIIPFFRGRNVWTIIGRGANSLSVVGRLSTLRSVHYQRFRCIIEVRVCKLQCVCVCYVYHRDHEGETVVYQWVECIRDYIANIQGNLIALR